MNAEDPRIRVCLSWCRLPPGSCDVHPDCPFYRPGKKLLYASVALERCKKVLEEMEPIESTEGSYRWESKQRI